MYLTIVLLPLCAAIVAGLGHRMLGHTGTFVITTGFAAFGALLSWYGVAMLDLGDARTTELFAWIVSGEFEAYWALRVDLLSALTLALVGTVSTLGQLHAAGHAPQPGDQADGDKGARLACYISLAAFGMAALVTADNVVQIVFGWQVTALAGYLLICVDRERSAANSSAITLLVTQQISSGLLIAGSAACFYLTGAVEIDAIAEALSGESVPVVWGELPAIDLICGFILLASMLASGQVIFHIGVMQTAEAPLSGRVMLQSATLALVGVFILCRFYPILTAAPMLLDIAIFIGVATAVLYAICAAVQSDLHRAIVCLACSQLGFAWFAVSAGSVEIAVVQLLALGLALALCALAAGAFGAVAGSSSELRKMVFSRTANPIAFWSLLVGVASLSGLGLPLLSIGLTGSLSYVSIFELAATLPDGGRTSLIGMLFLALPATSFAVCRLVLIPCTAEVSPEQQTLLQERRTPYLARAALVLLSLLVIVVGVLLQSVLGEVSTDQVVAAPAPELRWIAGLPVAAAFVGAGIAVATYTRVSFLLKAGIGVLAGVFLAIGSAPWILIATIGVLAVVLNVAIYRGFEQTLAKAIPPLHAFLLNLGYVDRLFDAVCRRLPLWLADVLWRRGDHGAIDGAINGFGLGLAPLLGRLAGRFQSGFVFHYALMMLLGVSVILFWYLSSGAS